MRKITFFLLLLSIGVLFNSCKRDIEIPAYLHIKAPVFKVNSGQGTDVQDIKHVAVFINDNLEGIFETPVTFPVLRKGNVNIDVRAYVKRTAREGFVNYTMMSGFVTSANLEETKVDTLAPVFEYQPNTKFEWLDDFNANTKSLVIDTNQSSIDTILVTDTKGPSVDNSLYAYIDMGPDPDPFFSIETEDQFSLPRDGRDVFLEFHYKTNVPVLVGLFEFDANGDFSATLPTVQTITTNGEWRKAYVYLNDELVAAPIGAKYKVYFRAINGEDGLRGEVFLDNLKLMYRE